VAVPAEGPDGFIVQRVTPLLYRRTRQAGGSHKVFATELEFWAACNSLPFASVCLDTFHLSEWFPRAPGVYWSQYGILARGTAYSNPVQNDRVLGSYYLPESKMSLIEQGGIGTIRLRPRRIDGTDCWLGTAVADRQCAGGVPLAVPHSMLEEANITWGQTVKVIGTVRFLQDVGLGHKLIKGIPL
jgi:hypothetical protein